MITLFSIMSEGHIVRICTRLRCKKNRIFMIRKGIRTYSNIRQESSKLILLFFLVWILNFSHIFVQIADILFDPKKPHKIKGKVGHPISCPEPRGSKVDRVFIFESNLKHAQESVMYSFAKSQMALRKKFYFPYSLYRRLW